MSTESWSSRIRHDSDPVWIEWRDEFIAKLNLMTPWLTADETNIAVGVGARAGTSSEAGYAVYHLSDSMHATAPVYIRFGFGTGSSASAPRVQITLGTATDGSGVLSGTATAGPSAIASSTGNGTTDTARQSYMSANDGFFGVLWKVGATGTLAGGFLFCRSCDSNGSPSATAGVGIWFNCNNAAPNRTAMLRFASPADVWQTTSSTLTDHILTLIPLGGVLTNTTVGTDIQAGLCLMYTPRVQPVFGIVGILNTEVAPLSTFQATPVGTTPRTFLVAGTDYNDIGVSLRPAFLWE